MKELSAITGVEIRTIRSYIEQGLVRGPEALGRNAYYTEHHRKRLETIRSLKDIYGLSMSEIRRVVTVAGDEDIKVMTLAMLRPEAAADRVAEPNVEYVASVRDRWRWRRMQESRVLSEYSASAVDPNETGLSGATPLGSPLDQLLGAIQKAVGDRRVARSARSETVTRIEITPDIALELKGDYPPRDRALFERLADYLRDVLVRGIEGQEEKPE